MNGLEASDEVRQYLVDLDYQDVDEILALIIQLRSSAQLKQLTEDGHRRIAQLFSSLLSAAVSYPNQYELLERVTRLLKALAGRKIYISLLVEYPQTARYTSA